MRDTAAPGATTRRILRPTVIGLVVATALGGLLAYYSAASWARTPTEAHAQGAPGVVPRSASSPAPSIDQVTGGVLGGETTEEDGGVTEEDGALPNGTTVFDDAHPGIAGLEPDLLRALRDSSRDAKRDYGSTTVSRRWLTR